MAIIPDEYRSYVDRLNKQELSDARYFWFYDIPQIVGDYKLTSYPTTNYTWLAWSSNGGQSGFSNTASNYNTPWLQRCEKLDIYINKVNNVYSYNVDVSRLDNRFLVLKNNDEVYFSSGWFTYSNNAYTISGGSQSTSSKTYSYSDANLGNVLENICNNFKNVNLYVDGVPWDDEPDGIIANGGGATHIAKVTGQLKDLSSNLSDILMVSGGGGGGLLAGDTDYSGKEAGGISGSGDNSADQSTGNAFGQGESGTNVSGGGSGLYGGYKGTSSKSGGAGSGYIGNSLLSNKKMVGYNVPTSSAEATKTESVNEVSASAVSGKPKSGNGFARIKFLRDFEPPEEYRQYIDNINGSGFDFIKNLQAQTFTGTFNGVVKTFPNMQYEPKTLSWYSYSHVGNDVPWSKNYFSNATSALFCSTEIDKVYITSNNGTYTCTITKDNSSNWSYTYNIGSYNGVVSGLDNPPYYNYGNFNDSLDYISNHNCNPWYTAGSWATQTFTGTLEQVFQNLQRYARNIDIYVDGVLWSKAGL